MENEPAEAPERQRNPHTGGWNAKFCCVVRSEEGARKWNLGPSKAQSF